jgi:hypothetical protein
MFAHPEAPKTPIWLLLVTTVPVTWYVLTVRCFYNSDLFVTFYNGVYHIILVAVLRRHVLILYTFTAVQNFRKRHMGFVNGNHTILRSEIGTRSDSAERIILIGNNTKLGRIIKN